MTKKLVLVILVTNLKVGHLSMLRTMVALLLLSMVGITAQAADAENNSIIDEKTVY